jgi:hypothetical protein
MTNPVPALAQVPSQKVNRYKRPEITDMPVVINGGAAGIHTYFAICKWLKFFDFARKCIEKTKAHKSKRTLILWGYGRYGKSVRGTATAGRYTLVELTLWGFYPIGQCPLKCELNRVWPRNEVGTWH